jgi:hypothetical protein
VSNIPEVSEQPQIIFQGRYHPRKTLAEELMTKIALEESQLTEIKKKMALYNKAKRDQCTPLKKLFHQENKQEYFEQFKKTIEHYTSLIHPLHLEQETIQAEINNLKVALDQIALEDDSPDVSELTTASRQRLLRG